MVSLKKIMSTFRMVQILNIDTPQESPTWSQCLPSLGSELVLQLICNINTHQDQTAMPILMVSSLCRELSYHCVLKDLAQLFALLCSTQKFVYHWVNKTISRSEQVSCAKKIALLCSMLNSLLCSWWKCLLKKLEVELSFWLFQGFELVLIV